MVLVNCPSLVYHLVSAVDSGSSGLCSSTVRGQRCGFGQDTNFPSTSLPSLAFTFTYPVHAKWHIRPLHSAANQLCCRCSVHLASRPPSSSFSLLLHVVLGLSRLLSWGNLANCLGLQRWTNVWRNSDSLVCACYSLKFKIPVCFE